MVSWKQRYRSQYTLSDLYSSRSVFLPEDGGPFNYITQFGMLSQHAGKVMLVKGKKQGWEHCFDSCCPRDTHQERDFTKVVAIFHHSDAP